VSGCGVCFAVLVPGALKKVCVAGVLLVVPVVGCVWILGRWGVLCGMAFVWVVLVWGSLCAVNSVCYDWVVGAAGCVEVCWWVGSWVVLVVLLVWWWGGCWCPHGGVCGGVVLVAVLSLMVGLWVLSLVLWFSWGGSLCICAQTGLCLFGCDTGGFSALCLVCTSVECVGVLGSFLFVVVSWVFFWFCVGQMSGWGLGGFFARESVCSGGLCVLVASRSTVLGGWQVRGGRRGWVGVAVQ